MKYPFLDLENKLPIFVKSMLHRRGKRNSAFDQQAEAKKSHHQEIEQVQPVAKVTLYLHGIRC